jgi:threonine/homoserine/homoserine lactone efflux protein
MTFETWAAFTAASTVLLIIPGPTVLLVVSYALGQGWRTARPMAVGVALGDFTAMTLSMLGLGALLAASATLFTLLKWVGAAYLVYLGVKLWRAGGALEAAPRTDAVSAGRMLGQPGLVTALNPRASPSSWPSCRPSSIPRPTS